MATLGICDKTQYEHHGAHEQIGEHGQMLPPFPCENWRAVVDKQTPEDLAEQLAMKLQEALSDKTLATLKKKLQDAVVDIGDELEYNLKDSLANSLAGYAEEMSFNTITALLEGDEERLRRYLKCTELSYTGRDSKHHVIRGELHESGGIDLRHRIVNLHADLLKSERILDLESQVRSLVAQVAAYEARLDRIHRENL